jgi:hypothetical protein
VGSNAAKKVEAVVKKTAKKKRNEELENAIIPDDGKEDPYWTAKGTPPENKDKMLKSDIDYSLGQEKDLFQDDPDFEQLMKEEKKDDYKRMYPVDDDEANLSFEEDKTWLYGKDGKSVKRDPAIDDALQK